VFGAATNSEGWAHYCEQMVIDEGFHSDNPPYRLAQSEERCAVLTAGFPRLIHQAWTAPAAADPKGNAWQRGDVVLTPRV
jgi:hypothetical protein